MVADPDNEPGFQRGQQGDTDRVSRHTGVAAGFVRVEEREGVPIDDRAAFETTTVRLNGAPAARIETDGQRAAVSFVVENGRITRIYATANPRTLTRQHEPVELAR